MDGYVFCGKHQKQSRIPRARCHAGSTGEEPPRHSEPQKSGGKYAIQLVDTKEWEKGDRERQNPEHTKSISKMPILINSLSLRVRSWGRHTRAESGTQEMSGCSDFGAQIANW